ncbi:hypothetical protein SDC9_197327 [bioreactor metagenome]|uniref:Uncharacterized protein n=1 Tax=bioreactor metagenome TaxID=1076179 RepID=A0A645IEJ2_9ZZZZ
MERPSEIRVSQTIHENGISAARVGRQAMNLNLMEIEQ